MPEWREHLKQAYTAAWLEERMLREDKAIHAEATDSGFRGLLDALVDLAPQVRMMVLHKCKPADGVKCEICGANCDA